MLQGEQKLYQRMGLNRNINLYLNHKMGFRDPNNNNNDDDDDNDNDDDDDDDNNNNNKDTKILQKPGHEEYRGQ